MQPSIAMPDWLRRAFPPSHDGLLRALITQMSREDLQEIAR